LYLKYSRIKNVKKHNTLTTKKGQLKTGSHAYFKNEMISREFIVVWIAKDRNILEEKQLIKLKFYF